MSYSTSDPTTPTKCLPTSQKRKRPPPLDLKTLLSPPPPPPPPRRPSISQSVKVTKNKIQAPYSPTRPSSPAEPNFPLESAKRIRLLTCSVTETFHSVHSPNIQSPAIQPDSTPVIRMRTSFTYSQLQTLEETFSTQNQISRLHGHQIAGQFELPVECITSWFSNRRHLKKKRDQRRLALIKLRARQNY